MESSSTLTAPPPTTAAPAAGKPAAYRLRWIVLAVVLCANIMDLLDSTIVNVAGPSIHRDLGGSASTLQWLSAGYTLAFAVLLIAGARLGDIFGRRRLLLIGEAGFTIFSAACATAPSMEVLIGFRALQGAFGALMIPQGIGLLKEVFPAEEMSKAMGLFGPAMGLPMLAAPVLAGVLVDANLWGTGWRLVFLINVPIGIVSCLIGLRTLPRGASHPGVKLDWGGVGIIGLALVAIIYPLIQGRTAGWPAWIFVMLAAGVALIGIFAIYEGRRTSDPLIEPTLLRNRAYLSGLAVLVSFFGAFGGLLLCVSLFGQLGEHWSPVHAGLTLMPMVVGMVGGMVGGFALLERLGRRLLQLGVVLVMGGTVGLALTTSGVATASTWDLVPSLFFIGMGAGMSIGQLFQFILAGVSMNDVGSASGVLEANQQLATALGVAVLGTIFFSAFGNSLPPHALQVTAWCCLAPLAAAFGFVFLLPMQPLPEDAAV